MKWVLGSLLVIALILVTRRLIPRPGAAVDRYEFEHWIHSFAKVKKDGALLTIRHAPSRAVLRFQRTQGSGDSCCLLFKVARTSWSEARLEALRDSLERHGYASSEPTSDLGTLLQSVVEVPDIWSPPSGAAGARLAHVALDALDIDPPARFDLSFEGENSVRLWGPTALRWKESGGPITSWLGRRLYRGVETEREHEKRDR